MKQGEQNFFANNSRADYKISAIIIRLFIQMYQRKKLLFFRLVEGDGYFDDGAATFTRRDGESALTHHFEAFADIVEGGMRLVVVFWLEAGTVVLDDDLDRRIRFSRGDGNVDGIVALSYTMYDGVLYDGLQGKRRYVETGIRRVEIDEQVVLILRLFD